MAQYRVRVSQLSEELYEFDAIDTAEAVEMVKELEEGMRRGEVDHDVFSFVTTTREETLAHYPEQVFREEVPHGWHV